MNRTNINRAIETKRPTYRRGGKTQPARLAPWIAIALLLALALLAFPTLTANAAFASSTWNVTIEVEGFGPIGPIQVEDGDAIAIEQLEQTEGFSAFEVEHSDDIFVLADAAGTEYYRTGTDSPPISGDLALTGHYEAPSSHTVAVTFANGQEALEVAVPAGQSWTGAGNAIPEDPQKQGHGFDGWIDMETEEAFDWNATIEKDTTVMAQWKADSEPSDTWENITPPTSVTGTALSTKSWKDTETSWGSERRFKMKFQDASNDWFWKNVAASVTASCADPGAWSAHTGEYEYVATRTSWDPNTGEATYDIVFSPTDETADKAYRGTHSMTGPLFQEHSGKSEGLQRAVVLDYKMKVQVKVPLQITKSSANEPLSSNNGSYSLAGAEYGIYASASDAEAGKDAIQTLTTDDTGTTPKSKMLTPGTYYVKEAAPAQGYALDEAVHKVEVKPANAKDGAVPVSVQDFPQNAPLNLLFCKLDRETGEQAAIEAASLEGAEFEVSYFDNTQGKTGGSPKRSWTFRTDAKGEVHLGDAYLVDGEFYTDSKGNPTLPLGTYAIRETKAPEGYLLNTETTVRTVTASGTGEAVETWEAPVDENGIKEQVKRGDIELTKVDGQTMEALPNVAFLLTAHDSGESHVVVTDGNGMLSTASSWNPHADSTNANDAALNTDETGNTVVDESKLSSYAGVWFGTNANGTVSEPDNELCALPYGTYTLTELPTSANANHTIVTRTFIISRDKVKLDLGTIDDNPLHIGTSASAQPGDDAIAHPDAKSVITDAVTYDGLTPGKEYRLEGTLMDKATGEPIEQNGKPVTAQTTFKPSTSYGTAEVAFELDSSQMLGTSVVVFEKLYDGTTQIAKHEDLEDEGQTIRFAAEIGTVATDMKDGDHQVAADAQVEIVDTVHFKGLTPGGKYTIKGTLMNKETSEPLIINGEEVTGETTFTPEASEGDAEVTFSFDTTGLDGSSTVVFEETYDAQETLVAEHKDIESDDQSIWVGDAPQQDEPQPDGPASALVKTFDSPIKLFVLAAALMAIMGVAAFNGYRFKRVYQLGLWDVFRSR